MEENIKDKIILILGILAVIFFIGTIGSCNSARLQKIGRDKEMITRLDLEEKMAKFTQDKSAIEEKAKASEKKLEEEKAARQELNKALIQEQLINKSLKEEMEKIIKLKEALESDLKEALVIDKSAKEKK